MKKKYFKLMIALVFIISIITTGEYYSKPLNYFQKIYSYSKGEVVENGIILSINREKESENVCKSWIKNMNFTKNNIKESISKDVFTVEFKNEKLSGFIQATPHKISINLKEEGNELNLNELKKKIDDSLICEKENYNLYKYMKVKIPNKNIKKVNQDLVSMLRKNRAKNINTIKLNNKSYNVVANTKNYNSIKDNDKDIDLNIAVYSYKSGNYILIGTPIIPISY